MDNSIACRHISVIGMLDLDLLELVVPFDRSVAKT